MPLGYEKMTVALGGLYCFWS